MDLKSSPMSGGTWVALLWFWLLSAQLCLGQGIPGLTSKPRNSFVEPERRWAVIIGVSEYENLPQKSWLRSCDQDAKALASFLQTARGGSVPSSQLMLLLNEKATARAIRIALDRVITESKAGDVVYLFYAGHGKVKPYGSSEAAYLMAYDSEPDYLNATAIPMDEIHRYVDSHLRQAAQVVLITDACHAGAIVSTSALSSEMKTRGLSEYLQLIGERSGVLNLMACRRDEVAYEDSRLGGHGVLTYTLLRALNGEGASTRGGLVRAQDVLQYVTHRVPRLTNQRQHPRHSSNYTDEFVLADLSKEGAHLNLPEPPGDILESTVGGSVFQRRVEGVTLKVSGAERMAEIYLVKGEEQRTVGRALSRTNVLVTEDLQPGDYQIVQLTQEGRESRWPLKVEKTDLFFDMATGELR